MKESCCQFGPRHALAGILTESAPPERTAAVLLVSAGLTPKFGPFRLYTELARRLARDGFRTLRFDLGGIGDSGDEYSERPLEERTRLQISAAVDYLSQGFELDRIVLAGLCSGAEDSFRHAEHDSRVTDVVMIDPFAHRTSGFVWRQLWYRAQMRLARAVGLHAARAGGRGKALVKYQRMASAEATRILRNLLARGVRLHFIYTAGMRETFNHEGQFRKMFRGIDFDGLIHLDYFPDLDHTQPFEADRRRLIEAIAQRLLG